MLLVEGALAKVQGAAGVIPHLSGAAIHRASMEITLDPSGLAEATGQNGVCVPALVAAFRKAMQAPEHAQFVHYGATSQDIVDTGLMLRLRQALTLAEADLRETLRTLAALAKAHAHTPMAARTFGQHATPTSFGAVVAAWGQPLVHLLQDLETLQSTCLCVSLSGAAGTGAALGEVTQTRADLAEALDLQDPMRPWHTDRTPVLKISDWMNRLSLSLGKMAVDLVAMTQTGIEEVSLNTSGASSTMPQKQNPVSPSAMIATKTAVTAAHSALQSASVQANQRDAGAWFTEWMMVPQVALGSATILGHAKRLSDTLTPNTSKMAQTIDASGGMVYAEALSFALAKTRLDATLFEPTQQLGDAPAQALTFAETVQLLG